MAPTRAVPGLFIRAQEILPTNDFFAVKCLKKSIQRFEMENRWIFNPKWTSTFSDPSQNLVFKR